MTETDATQANGTGQMNSIRRDPSLRQHLPRCWAYDARELDAGFSFSEEVRPWNWLELDAGEAAKLWGLLSSFVTYVNARYGDRSEHRVPPCWAEHGPVVEELTTLCFARWQAFSSEHASIGAAQHFHAYTLPAFYERLRFWLGGDLRSCQQGYHRDQDVHDVDLLEGWASRTGAIRDDDLWLRPDDDGSDPGIVGRTPSSLVPFVDRREP